MTADSQQSFKSGMTGLSVLGHARGERRRRESVVDTLRTGGDGRAYTGALDIAQRVANIHAKVNPVSPFFKKIANVGIARDGAWCGCTTKREWRG